LGKRVRILQITNQIRTSGKSLSMQTPDAAFNLARIGASMDAPVPAQKSVKYAG
jgi:hypothetical protein